MPSVHEHPKMEDAGGNDATNESRRKRQNIERLIPDSSCPDIPSHMKTRHADRESKKRENIAYVYDTPGEMIIVYRSTERKPTTGEILDPKCLETNLDREKEKEREVERERRPNSEREEEKEREREKETYTINTQPGFLEGNKRRRPNLGEILSPNFIEEWKKAEAIWALKSEKLKNERKEKFNKRKLIDMQPSESNSNEGEMVKESNNEGKMVKKRKLIVLQPSESNSNEGKMVKESNDEGKMVEANNGEGKMVKARNNYEISLTPGVAVKGRKLLIFDVNGLLGDIVKGCPKNRNADTYFRKYAVFKRPFLDDFLRFCFERFNICIWSSRTTQVLYPTVDCLLGDLKKHLLFIWDNSVCTKTGTNTFENTDKPMVLKDLKKVWVTGRPGFSWEKGTFHESNTLLLDDSPYKALVNPKYTGIFPKSYSYVDRNDDSLGPNGALRTYLEGLADSDDDVKTYVEQHPFGQSAIDDTHPRWTTYAKILRNHSTC